MTTTAAPAPAIPQRRQALLAIIDWAGTPAPASALAATVEGIFHPTVYTLDGLLPLAVIKDADGAILERDAEGHWWQTGANHDIDPTAITFPAKLLFPGVEVTP